MLDAGRATPVHPRYETMWSPNYSRAASLQPNAAVRAYEIWLPIYKYLVSSPSMNLAQLFHPAVERWFIGHFVQPTPAQAQAWPAIKAGRHSLIAAPTGRGGLDKVANKPP